MYCTCFYLYIYQQSIPPSQFLILPSERLQTEPEETMRKVYQFLGLIPDNTDSNVIGDTKAVTEGHALFGSTHSEDAALLKRAGSFLRNTSRVSLAVNKFFPSKFLLLIITILHPFHSIL